MSGHWPYYKGMDEMGHPPDFLHYRLESKPNCPLVLQDLKELSEVRDEDYYYYYFVFGYVVLGNISIWNARDWKGGRAIRLLFYTTF